MGGKASDYLKSDRPESGGADKDMIREKSGLKERDKEKFAVEDQKRQAGHNDHSIQSSSFSIDNEPNNVPKRDTRDDE